MYKCPNCGESISYLPEEKVHCTNCGFRLLFKERPPVVKTVLAR